MDEPPVSGERLVPGKSSARVEADHVSRYLWAGDYVSRRRVADVACGAGYGTAMLLTAGATEVLGVDISEEAVEFARSHYAQDGLTFEVGDAANFGDPGHFDVVISFETIEHVPSARAVLASFYRVLRPGGVLLVSSPNRPVTSPRAASLQDKPANEFHVCEYTPRELRRELESVGFEVASGHWGQRLQPPVPRRLQRIFEHLVHPSARSSPAVRRCRFFSPRYFILSATRPGHD